MVSHATAARPGRRLVPALVGGLVALAGCSAAGEPGDPAPATEAWRFVTVDTARVAFELRVDRRFGITDVADPGPCGTVTYRLEDAERSRLVVEAVPAACAEAGADEQIGNGFHGLYRTLDDVPAPLDPATVATGLGEATVFEQNYYECTSECTDVAEPVAFVTLSRPVDPAYPTLVVRAEQAVLDRAGLVDLLGRVRGVAPAPGP